jgi:GTP-binding protein
MADVPGLIEGAADGAGLGLQFLKHLQRTRLLLHLVDIAPIDARVNPAQEVIAIQRELEKFSGDLTDKPCWLVVNKTDLLAEDEFAKKRDALLSQLDWSGPVFEISAIAGSGTENLGQEIMQKLDSMAIALLQPEADLADQAVDE